MPAVSAAAPVDRTDLAQGSGRFERRGFALLVPTETEGQAARTWRCVPLPALAVVGTDAACAVRLPRLLPRHCRLALKDGQLQVVDLEGETTLRGIPVGPRAVALQPGDVLRLGRLPVVVAAGRRRGGKTWLQVGELGSADPVMWRAMAELALAAGSDWPLLLQGESGCGKELAARLVHDRSRRRDAPWVAVNCAALHGDTLVAELFGAARGAYTGSVEARRGAFERADGGTLFLDEIGELSPAAQAALLRVLEVGEVQVLGGPVRRVDVRLVCATHRDLQAEVAVGRFRLDLLHRVAVAEVRLPALRERRGDVVPLLEDLLGAPLPDGSAQALACHGFAGNVRELRNIVRRLQIYAGGGEPALAELVAAAGPGRTPTPGSACAAPVPVQRNTGAVGSAARRRNVAGLVAEGSATCAAWRASGLPRGTFYRYLKQVRAEAGATATA